MSTTPIPPATVEDEVDIIRAMDHEVTVLKKNLDQINAMRTEAEA